MVIYKVDVETILHPMKIPMLMARASIAQIQANISKRYL